MTVAFVQVQHCVRRPVPSDTFIATEARWDGRFLQVRGCWRNSREERAYSFPAESIIAVRWTEAA